MTNLKELHFISTCYEVCCVLSTLMHEEKNQKKLLKHVQKEYTQVIEKGTHCCLFPPLWISKLKRPQNDDDPNVHNIR